MYLDTSILAKSIMDRSIVAGNGVEGWFLDPGSIDPDRGSGTTAGRRGSTAESRPRSVDADLPKIARRRIGIRYPASPPPAIYPISVQPLKVTPAADRIVPVSRRQCAGACPTPFFCRRRRVGSSLLGEVGGNVGQK
jgi:hypothetical protein